MKIHTWQSAPNEQGWKKVKCADGTIVLENIKTGKLIDKGFVHTDLPNNAGWIFAEYDIEGEKELFNVNSEKFFKPDDYIILSKPNSKGWMCVRHENTTTFYNIYTRKYSDITCKHAKSLGEDSWSTVELDDGFTYANPEINIILPIRFEREYYLSWHTVCIECPDAFKYLPTVVKEKYQNNESE